MKHYLSEKTVTLTIADGIASLPDDFREMRLITGSKTYKPVSPMSAVLACDEVRLLSCEW